MGQWEVSSVGCVGHVAGTEGWQLTEPGEPGGSPRYPLIKVELASTSSVPGSPCLCFHEHSTLGIVATVATRSAVVWNYFYFSIRYPVRFSTRL